MNNVMLDCEAMGTGPDGALVSIGAVFFDEATGQMGDEFYRVVNLATAVAEGGEIDASTVMWWMAQDDTARQAISFNNVHIREALQDFIDWCGRRASEADLVVWGCSPTFDCLKVERAIKRLGHHNALEDAKYQAQHLLKIAAARRARSAV